MNTDELETKIGIMIFDEIQKEELLIGINKPGFKFRPKFKFELAMRIREIIKESENGNKGSN